METTTVAEFGINLFGENLPSLEELSRLAALVHSGETSQAKFREQVEANMGKTSHKDLLAIGIGLFILGKYAEAAEKLKKATDRREKFIYLAFALRRLKKFDEAVENLRKSLGEGADTLSITLEKAATYRYASNFEAAEKELKSCANFENVSADYHYQLARLQESRGFYEDSEKNYKLALELSPNHQKTLFHLAYRCDLSGDEEAAIDYYKQAVTTSPAYVSALLNLTVLYEDTAQFDKAEQCIEKVLEAHPNHLRALMFKKDIESSKTMFYDEERERSKTRKTQLLETPITDFELSVRSRNCLKKMNIDTIGDLLNISEAELLSYKNFGETSLREIKAVLEPRGLHLGMALEEKKVVTLTAEISDFDNNADDDSEMLNKPVDDLILSVRARNCMNKLNISTLAELVNKTEAELLGIKNFGVTSLNEIKKALAKFGLSLRNLD